MRVRMGKFVYESADEDATKTAALRDQIKSLNDQISTLVGEDPERAAGLVGQKSELEKQLVLQVGAAAKAQKAAGGDQNVPTDRQSNIIAPDQGTKADIADGTPVSAPSVDSDNNAVVSNDGAIVSMPQLESALKVLGAPKRIRVGGKLFEAVSVDMPKKVRIGGYIYEAVSLETECDDYGSPVEESVSREEVEVGDGAGLNHYTDTAKFSEALVDSLNSLKHRGVCAEATDDDDVIVTVGEYKAKLILSDATLEAYQEGPGSDLIFRYVVEDAIERTPGYTYVEETSNEGSNRVDVYSADETSELHIYIKQIKSHRPEEDGSVATSDVID